MGEIVRTLMCRLHQLLPGNGDRENPTAVAAIRAVERAKDLAAAGPLRRALRASRTGRVWPVTPGAYALGDLSGPIAICTLTSNDLMAPLAALRGVAIAGRVYTPNLGVERIVRNVTANRNLRYLLLCGRESPIFHPAQALQALLQNGVAPDGRIIGAEGPVPVLRGVSATRIDAFRRQVELVDQTGTVDVAALARVVEELTRRGPPAPTVGRPDPEALAMASDEEPASESFAVIRPGGRRRSLTYDPTGFFILTLDRPAGEIVCRHYRADHTAAHEMRGHSAEAMLLGLLEAGLVSQLSHAGYLGSELTKAETALRLGLPYEQDRPLRLDRT
jgi:tetrahydromethanopterin S-methyltransferase subunit A